MKSKGVSFTFWRWLVVAVTLEEMYSVSAFVCHTSSHNPCTCSNDQYSIDIFPISEKFSTTVPGYYFQYHPCNAFQCSTVDKQFMLCMHDDNTSKEYGLGMVTSSTVWNVTSMDPLNFTITYYNGDQYDNRNLYSTVRVIYKESRISSKLKFLKSVLQSGNETELYEFEFLTTDVSINNNTEGTVRIWIAGAVVGSWLGLVVAVSLVVVAVISINVSLYRRKIKKDTYQRLNPAPAPVPVPVPVPTPAPEQHPD